MSLEVGGKQLDRAFNGRAWHGDEITKSLALVEGENFAELLENRRPALAGLDFLQHQRQGVGLHAASWTLAAGLSSEKLGDPQNFLNDTLAFADEMHHAAAERRPGVAHRVVIQRRVDLLR